MASVLPSFNAMTPSAHFDALESYSGNHRFPLRTAKSARSSGCMCAMPVIAEVVPLALSHRAVATSPHEVLRNDARVRSRCGFRFRPIRTKEDRNEVVRSENLARSESQRPITVTDQPVVQRAAKASVSTRVCRIRALRRK